MGFKFRRVNLTAGSTDFPVGDTDALRRTRSEAVLTKCVQAIIDCNVGWLLDSTHNVNISDFSNVPCKLGSLTFPGLFLINSESGCKMFISYFGGDQTGYYCIKDFKEPDNNQLPMDLIVYSQSFIGGLCVSILPGESASSFGLSFDSSFLPNEATRIVGTTVHWQSIYNPTSFACNPTSGYIYSWGLFVNPYCISVSCSLGNGVNGTLGIPTYASGRIIGILGHVEDNKVNSKYGVLLFRWGENKYSQTEGITDLFGKTYSCFAGTTPHLMGRCLDNKPIYEEACASFCDYNGNWIKGDTLSDVVVNPCFYTQDLFSTSSRIFSKTGEVRWSPFALCAPTTDIENHYVVPGDSYKGIVDTDLFRVATVSPYGSLFDNGNFISLDENVAFIIGWDPSNVL